MLFADVVAEAANTTLHWSEYGRNVATIIAAVIALVVFVYNSLQQRNQRNIDNLTRFNAFHRTMFSTGFVHNNWMSIEKGTFQRNHNDDNQEREWRQFLGDMEYLALMKNTKAISETIDIYMLGWWAQKIKPLLTAAERCNPYWELAVEFIDDLSDKADSFNRLTRRQRAAYHKKGKFPK